MRGWRVRRGIRALQGRRAGYSGGVLRTRLMILGLLLAIAAGTGVIVGFVLPRLQLVRSAPAVLNTAAVLKQVQGLSQLVTVKYVIEKVVILEDVKWYGESRVLLVAHGVVKAGVDLQGLQPGDLTVTGQRVEVALPPPAMFDVYLDDTRTQVIEHRTGGLRTFDKDLQQDARRQAIDDIRRAARQSGIVEDAMERARHQVRALLLQLGFTEVEFKQRGRS